jgi:hypothetical protein
VTSPTPPSPTAGARYVISSLQTASHSSPAVAWPNGHRFAFTVFDDTDEGTLDNVPHVYAFLHNLGFATTKSVWPLGGQRRPDIVGGETCAHAGYAAWVQALQKQQFEIALHNATFHSSIREETERGFARFVELFGQYPRSMANHTTCREGIYWGPHRVSGTQRIAYNVLTRFRHRGRFRGHDPDDPHFWGDICQEHVDYVRNFTFADVDTLAACPFMPYFDPDRPWVKAWFAGSEGADCRSYVRTLDERAQERLEAAGGACIMYTHFGKGFCEHGALDRRFVELMERLARRPGWFVPVSQMLDHIAQARGGIHILRHAERTRLERRWLRHKIVAGST